MGKFNSSKCVVKPVFDELLKDNTLISFLELVLPKRIDIGEIRNVRYEGHPREKSFAPAPEFLNWCRQHPDELLNPELASEKVKVNPQYKFEGNTHPDVYIETTKIRVVIEAKWTEPRITSHTTWRKEGERDQLIRHMDALIPIQEDGDAPISVFGLFIIDAHGKISKSALEGLFHSDWYYKVSLPHRVDDGKYRRVMNGFAGVFTWQYIKNQLGLSEPYFC